MNPKNFCYIYCVNKGNKIYSMYNKVNVQYLIHLFQSKNNGIIQENNNTGERNENKENLLTNIS